MSGVRTGRLFLPALSKDTAKMLMTRDAVEPPPDWEAKWENANQVWMSRRPSAPPEIEDFGADQSDHIERLQQFPVFQRLYGGRKWSVRLIEISKIRSLVWWINTGYAENSTGEVENEDNSKLLQLCLPTDLPRRPVEIGLTKESPPGFLMVTDDLNLTVVEAGIESTSGQEMQVVFKIGRNAVFMEVVSLGGHYLLKDGHHRAYSLMARGIKRVPCILVEGEDLSRIEHQNKPYALSPETFLGDKAPVVADLLDPDLTLNVKLRGMIRLLRFRTEEVIIPTSVPLVEQTV